MAQAQDVVAGELRQAVDLRRPDGTVWRAYTRNLALPEEASAVARLVREATIILDLAARAIAAADTARAGRAAPRPWPGTTAGPPRQP